MKPLTIAACCLIGLPWSACAELGNLGLAENPALAGAFAAAQDPRTKSLDGLKGFGNLRFDAAGASQAPAPQLPAGLGKQQSEMAPPIRYVPPKRVRRFAFAGALAGVVAGGLAFGPLGALAGGLVGFAAGTYAGHGINEPVVGLVAGAVAGGMLAGPPGIVIGGVLGGLMGLTLSFLS